MVLTDCLSARYSSQSLNRKCSGACCDIFILVSCFKYGKQYLLDKGKPYFMSFSIMAVVLGFMLQFAFYFYCENAEIALIYTAFAQNAAMYVLFLTMLFQRNDTKAQSITIAVCKWIGTLTPTIYGSLNGINIYILLTGIVCCILDLTYIYFLWKFKNQETILQLCSESVSVQ